MVVDARRHDFRRFLKARRSCMLRFRSDGDNHHGVSPDTAGPRTFAGIGRLQQPAARETSVRAGADAANTALGRRHAGRTVARELRSCGAALHGEPRAAEHRCERRADLYGEVEHRHAAAGPGPQSADQPHHIGRPCAGRDRLEQSGRAAAHPTAGACCWRRPRAGGDFLRRQTARGEKGALGRRLCVEPHARRQAMGSQRGGRRRLRPVLAVHRSDRGRARSGGHLHHRVEGSGCAWQRQADRHHRRGRQAHVSLARQTSQHLRHLDQRRPVQAAAG